MLIAAMSILAPVIANAGQLAEGKAPTPDEAQQLATKLSN